MFFFLNFEISLHEKRCKIRHSHQISNCVISILLCNFLLLFSAICSILLSAVTNTHTHDKILRRAHSTDSFEIRFSTEMCGECAYLRRPDTTLRFGCCHTQKFLLLGPFLSFSPANSCAQVFVSSCNVSAFNSIVYKSSLTRARVKQFFLNRMRRRMNMFHLKIVVRRWFRKKKNIMNSFQYHYILCILC